MNEWYWLVALVAACFGIGAILGAPYLPIRKADTEAALDLAGVKAGQTIIDLGSGDGRLLLAAAKRGATAIGYEINPILYTWSLIVCWRQRRRITIHLGDYWRVRLPVADVIYVFLITRYMPKLDTKLSIELHQPTTVVSYVFELPRKPIKKSDNTYVYRYP